MPGKAYNAGTIFLQVVPVFGDVQRAIGREAKDWNKTLGDAMEEGGKQAGARAADKIGEELEKGAKRDGKVAATAFQKEFDAAVKGIGKNLEPINLRFQNNEVAAQIKAIREEVEELSKTKIRTELDAKRAEGRIRVLSAQLQGLQEDAKINAKLDVKQAVAAATAFEKRLDSLQKAADIEVRMETKMAERSLGAFEKKIRDTARKSADALGDSMNPAIRRIRSELEGLADAEIGIDISDAEARRKLEDLMRETRRLAYESPDIEVKVNAGRAEAELAALWSAMRVIDGDDIDIRVDVDTGGAVAKMGLLKSLLNPRDVDATANAFRSFNIRVLAAVTLIPALIPIVGALGGALLGLVPILMSVGAGFGAMLVGFSGIGDAVGALGDRADDAAKDTNAASKQIKTASYAVADARQGVADAERSAAQASADAARQVADARRTAADAIEDALDRQREAQEAYRDSVQDVRDAEQDLREARKRAAEEDAAQSADLKDRARQNKLDIREAVLGAFTATDNYNAVMADGSSTAYDKEAAEVNMLQARERLHELRDLEREIAQERKQNRDEGVADNSAVESAQDALTDALERQRDAQESVGEAAQAVAEARVEGARQVQDAIRQQQRTEADGQRSIARAEEALRRAIEARGQVLYETGEIGSASMQKVEEAMGKLGPAGRKFARFLFSLRDDFYAFRDAIQQAMLPGIQRAFEAIINRYGPQFTSFMVKMGAVVGDWFESLAASLQGPAWRQFFEIMDRLGPRMAAEFGQTTLNWMEVFASIMTAVAPFAERMSMAMLRMSEGAARWAASEKGQATITSFMEYAERIGPRVIAFLESFVMAAINLGVALAPWGGLVMDALTGILDWIASLDPKVLGVYAAGIIGIVIAWQAAVGVVAAVTAGATAFATMAGRLVFGVVALAAILAVLALRFDGVREALATVGDWISEHRDLLMKLGTAVLIAVAAYRTWRFVMAVVAAVQVGLAAATYGAVGATYAQAGAARVAYLAGRLWAGGILAVAAAQRILNLTFLGFPLTWVLLAIAAVITAIVLLWKNNEGFRNAVIKLWGAIKDAFRAAWNFIKPILEKIGDAIKWLWKKVFKPAFGFIWDIVKTVFKGIKTLWNKILWPVIKFIAKVIWELFKANFKVVFKLIEIAWKVLVVAFKAWWKFHGEPLFKAVAKILKWLWENIAKPTFNWIKDAWKSMVTRIKENWERYGKPVMDAIGDKVLPKLKSAFRTTVDAIKDIWDDLKRIVGTPIKFVIEDVLNNGLIAGFNKVARFVNGPTIDRIDVPDWTKNYATGGVLPGYTPGRDVHQFYSPTGGRLNLSGGEAILRPEATAALGSGWVDEVNRAARFGGQRGVRRAMGFAKGGIWHPGTRSHDTADVLDQAWDINSVGGTGTPVRAFLDGIVTRAVRQLTSFGNYAMINHPAAGLQTLYAHMSELYVNAGQAVKRGEMIGREGDVGNSFGAHLHFEIGGGQSAIDAAGSGGGDGGPSLPGWLEKIVGKPMEWARGLFDKASDFVTDKFGDSPFLTTVLGLGRKLIDPLVDKVTDLFGSREFKAMSLTDAVSGGAAQAAVRAIAANYGWNDGSQWAALVKLVQGESGWDPTAENPTTTASGLFQFIDGTAQAYGLPGHASNFSVPAQAKAGLRYIKARYGNPLNAYQTWLGRDPHWYKDGGVLPGDLGADSGGKAAPAAGYNGTMMYDSGGYLPPGITTVVNLTGKPEPVFTSDQFEGMRNGGGGGITYAPTITEANLTSEDLMDDFEFTYRKLSRKGGSKYEGSKS